MIRPRHALRMTAYACRYLAESSLCGGYTETGRYDIGANQVGLSAYINYSNCGIRKDRFQGDHLEHIKLHFIGASNYLNRRQEDPHSSIEPLPMRNLR